MSRERSVCWHVSSSVNRASIERYGLDWRRMGATGGVASGGAGIPGFVPRPEAAGVFLCETLDDVEMFVSFGQHPIVDVWEVHAAGLDLADSPDGWLLVGAPIPLSRLRLAQRDRSSERRTLSSVALAFVSGRLTADQMSELAGVNPDRGGAMDGSVDPPSGMARSYWILEGHDEYASVQEQITPLFNRIAAAEHGIARLRPECDSAELGISIRVASPGTHVPAPSLDPSHTELLERLGVEIRLHTAD